MQMEMEKGGMMYALPSLAPFDMAKTEIENIATDLSMLKGSSISSSQFVITWFVFPNPHFQDHNN